MKYVVCFCITVPIARVAEPRCMCGCVRVCDFCRKLSQLHELPVTESPALSPCVSVAGLESPADHTSHVCTRAVLSFGSCSEPQHHCVIFQPSVGRPVATIGSFHIQVGCGETWSSLGSVFIFILC